MKLRTGLFVPCAIAAALAAAAFGCDGKGGGDDKGGDGGTTASGDGAGGGGGDDPAEGKQATATILPKSGSTTTGTAIFTTSGNMVTLKVEVSGAPPGEHAVHIHEHPDCSSDDAESAGGHWNPTMKDHGKWGVDPFHLGDIGNMMVDADGTGTIELTTDLWTVGTGEMNDVVGHALMVHANPDDFVTQPTGNAGARIGCGVIELE